MRTAFAKRWRRSLFDLRADPLGSVDETVSLGDAQICFGADPLGFLGQDFGFGEKVCGRSEHEISGLGRRHRDARSTASSAAFHIGSPPHIHYA